MKYNKQKLIPIILVSLSCILFVVAIVLLLNTNYFEFSNKTDHKENSQNQVKEEDKNPQVETDSNHQNSETESNNNTNHNITVEEEKPQNNTSSKPNNNVVEENKTEPNASNNSSPNPTETVTKNELNVLSFFETQDNMITETSNQDDRTLREKAKDAFVTVVDFIFYDKEIKGYTFKELTTSAKLKVIKLALSIDHKIDEYFPDYKEVIKDKYDNIKGKLAVKYLEFTSSLCDSVGVDTCNQAKEDFNTMKESFGITWQLIKELASSGSSKVKDFYELWRDSE